MIRRTGAVTALLLAATLALAACTPPAATPNGWQQNVQTIAEQAAAGDYASALAGLDTLEADVTTRRDAGELTAEEADGILTRVATVRADLTALVPTPTPTPMPTTDPEPQDESTVPADTSGGDDQSGPSQPGPGAPDDRGGKDKGGGKDGTGPGSGQGPGKKDG